MDWLVHNPVIAMDGPTFLLVYVLVAIVVIWASYILVNERDTTGLREPPQIPATFDPYQIAYLRGGKNAVIRTVLYALYQRGLVEVIPGKWLKGSQLVARHVGRGETLTGLEDRVLGSIRSPVEPSKLFESGLGSGVELLCEPFRKRLESTQLFRSDAARNSALVIPIAASAILVSFSLYRILATINAMPGRKSFNFLLVLTVVSVALVGFLAGRAARAQISALGRTYLARMQAAYRGANMSPVQMVGLFGIGILSETPDAAFAKLFPKSGSGWGADVVSSGCGSGGCGGCGGGD